MSFIYLAQPYSHPDSRVRAARFKIAEFMTAFYSQSQEVIYSPIVHFHKISEHYSLPKDFEFWKNNCITMLEQADHLRVLEMPGWGKSQGLKAEIDFFHCNKPYVQVEYVFWKEIVYFASNHQDEEGLNPLRFYLQTLGAVL